MENYVYVLSVHEVSDGEVYSEDTRVFAREADCLLEFTKIKKEIKKELADSGWNIEEESWCLQCYEPGCYANNHSDVWYRKVVVE